ncbi:MAG TPA: LysM peptidoglycan-binding domain-containing protein [Anaerolineales bacterium]|nr:LysM peptidoglycan-binding domain-containing protein [Anaerolineales bacterium]
MKKIFRISLSSIILLVLSACNLFGSPNPVAGETSVVRLSVQTQNGVSTFSKAGETIKYNYLVTNTGSAHLAGPVIVNDAPRAPTCPDLATVGNGDIYLDLNETVTCQGSYAITDSDVNTGSVTNLATALVGGVTSNQTGVTLALGVAQASSVLTLKKTASSQTYGKAGETIDYVFTLTNVGTTPLGPAQFVINDNKLGGSVPCGPDQTTIAPNQPLSCTKTYTITADDMALTTLINTAIASGAGQTTAPASTTVTNLTAPATQTPTNIQTATPGPASNLTPGSTIQHQVAVGEWLIQIARCYGAKFDDVRNANPQIADPDFILPSMIIVVPRIGSAGKIYGPPCITFYTVQSGDSWTSIAQRYNADLAVLQHVNPVTLSTGTVIKIPLNSAGAAGVVVPSTSTVPTNTASPNTTSQPVTFPAGQNTASLAGVVSPNQTIQYVVSATQGQELTINLIANPNEIFIGVNGPTGIALKQMDGLYQWHTTITTSGNYFINVTSALGSSLKNYTLQVTLSGSAPPATATPTATPTSTPPTPGS